MTDTASGPATFDAILALGSNVGDKAANIARALEMIADRGDVRVIARSRLYKTPPWGVLEQDWFLNACALVATRLGPHALLERCQDVERRLGRVRLMRWGPRVIDVDILVHRAGAVNDAALTLPHPRITDRAFVLAPLNDIAPDLEIAGTSVAVWLDRTDRTGVEPIAD